MRRALEGFETPRRRGPPSHLTPWGNWCRCWPTRYFPSRGTVDEDDCLIGRVIRENSIAAPIELEALGMRLQLDVGDFASAGWIDDRQSAAICHNHLVADCIHTHIVGVFTQWHPRDRPVIIAAENGQRSVAAVGDVQSVRRGMIAKPLRVLQTGNNRGSFILPPPEGSSLCNSGRFFGAR